MAIKVKKTRAQKAQALITRIERLRQKAREAEDIYDSLEVTGNIADLEERLEELGYCYLSDLEVDTPGWYSYGLGGE